MNESLFVYSVPVYNEILYQTEKNTVHVKIKSCMTESCLNRNFHPALLRFILVSFTVLV